MEREKIVERDFMGLTNANGGIEEDADKDKEKATKDFNTDSTAQAGNNYPVASGVPCRQYGVSSLVYSAGSIDGSSSSAHPIEEARGFPSSNLSLSMPNFREHIGSPAFLKGQPTYAATCITPPVVKPFASLPLSGQHSFFPAASTIYGGSTPARATDLPGKPASAQLTIFYAGIVNVYDDVPADKAQGLMLLAGSARSPKVTNLPPRSSAISTTTAVGSHSMPTTPPFCSNRQNRVFPITPQAPPQKAQPSIQHSEPAAVTSSSGDSQVNQTIVTPSNQQEASKSSPAGITPARIIPRVPQARKASLARFLEKRKERVHTQVPPAAKKSPDCSSQRENSQSPKRCSTSPPLDGRPSKQHKLMGNGDEKFPINSECMTSFPDRHEEEKSCFLEDEMNEREECETTVEVRSA